MCRVLRHPIHNEEEPVSNYSVGNSRSERKQLVRGGAAKLKTHRWCAGSFGHDNGDYCPIYFPLPDLKAWGVREMRVPVALDVNWPPDESRLTRLRRSLDKRSRSNSPIKSICALTVRRGGRTGRKPRGAWGRVYSCFVWERKDSHMLNAGCPDDKTPRSRCLSEMQGCARSVSVVRQPAVLSERDVCSRGFENLRDAQKKANVAISIIPRTIGANGSSRVKEALGLQGVIQRQWLMAGLAPRRGIEPLFST